MKRHQFLSGIAALCCTLGAFAQPAGQLYDPEPPADSGYVRVIVVGDAGLDVHIDGKARVSKLKGSEVSDYMVLKAGSREISLLPGGKAAGAVKHKIEVPQGKALTVAFMSMKDAPKLFTDTANTNRLKSVLGVYHLHEKAGALDITTVDGATKVFSNLAAGTSSSLSVNPISVDLVANKAGSTGSKDAAKLTMAQGATYSLLVLPGAGGKTQLVALQNKTERYTGK